METSLKELGTFSNFQLNFHLFKTSRTEFLRNDFFPPGIFKLWWNLSMMKLSRFHRNSSHSLPSTQSRPPAIDLHIKAFAFLKIQHNLHLGQWNLNGLSICVWYFQKCFSWFPHSHTNRHIKLYIESKMVGLMREFGFGEALKCESKC